MAEVAEVMDHLTTAFPNSPDALEMKARMAQWLGKTADSVKLWKQCLELDASYVHAIVGLAQTSAEKAEHQEAADFASRAIEIDPANFQARSVLADSLIHLRRPADALAALEDHLKLDPRSRGFYLVGQAYADLKQYDKARDSLEAAIAKYPEYAEAYYLLSRMYRELGNEEMAARRLAEYQKLATPERTVMGNRPKAATEIEQMYPTAAVLYSDAGQLLMLRERADEAENYWRRAANLDPRNIAARQALAFRCRNQGRIGETIIWFKELAEIEPANIAYWLEMGKLFEELQALPAAESAFRKAYEIAPERAEGYAAAADLLVRYEQKLPESVTLAYSAVRYNPSAPNFALLSAAYLANGEHTAALSAINQALQMAPQSASYRAVLDAIKKEQAAAVVVPQG